MTAFFHLLDISSDYTYLTTVPVYDVVLYRILVASMALPAIPLLYIAITAKGWSLCKRPLYIVFGYIGLFDLLFYNLRDDKDSVEKSLRINAGTQMAFGIAEDVPQFSIQSINSVFIGQSLTAIQVISPVSGFFSLN